MTSAFSWQNSISLCPVSFRIPRPNLPVTPGVSLASYICIPVPYNEKDIFFGCWLSKVLQVFIEPFSFFSITSQGIDLDYCDIKWFALEMNRDHSVIFEIASKYCIMDSFCWLWWLLHSSKGFLPTVVDIMVIWVKFHPFQSILVHYFLESPHSLLPSPIWPLSICLNLWT